MKKNALFVRIFVSRYPNTYDTNFVQKFCEWAMKEMFRNKAL